jgi:hypothetical protein
MIVKFAELCDTCGRRSEEYTTWLTCRDCGEDVCYMCGHDIIAPDMDKGSAVCPDCYHASSTWCLCNETGHWRYANCSLHRL